VFADYIPLAILATASLLLGIFASPVFDFVMQAGNQLFEPSDYINAVLSNQVP